MSYAIDKKQQEKLERQHCKVQEEIKKLPQDQQDFVKNAQRMVDLEIEAQNDAHFSGTRFELDDFLSTHGISGSDRGDFVKQLKATHKGKTFTFLTKTGYQAFYRSLTDQLMSADDYIYTLEYSVLNTNKLALKKLFTNYSVWFIIKTTVSTIFNRILGGFHGTKETEEKTAKANS